MDSISKNTLNELREGSHKAFEKVFIVYYNKIKTFIFGCIKSDVDAEELTENIFVRLWINRESIDVARSFSSYMHTVARNSALNFLKHKFVHESHLNFSKFSVADSFISIADTTKKQNLKKSVHSATQSEASKNTLYKT